LLPTVADVAMLSSFSYIFLFFLFLYFLSLLKKSRQQRQHGNKPSIYAALRVAVEHLYGNKMPSLGNIVHNLNTY